MDDREEPQTYSWEGVVAVAGALTQEPLPRMLEIYTSLKLSRPLPLPVVHIDGEVIGQLDKLWLRPQLDRSVDLMASGSIRLGGSRYADLAGKHGGRMTVAADIMEARTRLVDDGTPEGLAVLLMSGWVLAAVTVGGAHPAWPDRTGIHVRPASATTSRPPEMLSVPPADEPALP